MSEPRQPDYATRAPDLPAGQRVAHPLLVWPAVVCGVIALGILASVLGVRGFLLGTLVAVMPVPAYVMLALWLDRFEAEPPQVLAQTFAWGATVAVLVAMLVTSFAEEAVGAVFGHGVGAFFGSAVSAPVVEEVAKGLALLILYVELEDEFDGVVDGVVYACMVGLGFGMVENIQYYGEALTGMVDNEPLSVFLTRGMVTPFAHPFFTAMLGIGLGLAREAPDDERRSLPPLIGLMTAVALHSLWNVAAQSTEWFFLAYLLVMVPAFLGVLWLIVVSLRREGAVIREHLEPLMEQGLLEPSELECLCNARQRTRATLRAWWHGGRTQWRDRRELHQVASELAFHRWRVGRGLSRGELLDAARDAEYVRQLRELCLRISREGRNSLG